MRALPALLVLCLVQVGCTTTPAQADTAPPKPNTHADSDDADADKPIGPIGDDKADEDPAPADKPSRAPVAAAELPDCPSEADNRNLLLSYCTEDAKLAGAWVPVDTLKIPDDVEIIFNAGGPEGADRTSLMIAVRGDQLFIQQVTCGVCRRVLGQGFAGHLSHMSAEQIAAMQAQLGLGEDVPALDSIEKWASFVSDERGQAALTTLAAKTEGAPLSEGR